MTVTMFKIKHSQVDIQMFQWPRQITVPQRMSNMERVGSIQILAELLKIECVLYT